MGKRGLMKLKDFCPSECQPTEKLEDAAKSHIMASEAYLQNVYCVAVTEDGIFPKFVQSHDLVPEINMAGAPALGISIPEEYAWIFTPIVEYKREGYKVKGLSGIEVGDTWTYGIDRVRIKGVHDHSRSPLFKLSNGLHEITLLIRRDQKEQAQRKVARMFEEGSLPLSDERPEANGGPEIDQAMALRLNTLLKAFERYMKGRLDPHTQHGRKKMLELHLRDRDIALFKRYSDYLKGFDDNPAGLPSAMAIVRNKLLREAEQFSSDMYEKTVIMESEPVSEDPPDVRMMKEMETLNPSYNAIPWGETRSIRLTNFMKDLLGEIGLVDAWTYSRDEVAIDSTLSLLPLSMAESEKFGKEIAPPQMRRVLNIHGEYYSVWKGRSRDALILRWGHDSMTVTRDYPSDIRQIARDYFPELKKKRSAAQRKGPGEQRLG
jgi:hypothetical protein